MKIVQLYEGTFVTMGKNCYKRGIHGPDDGNL